MEKNSNFIFKGQSQFPANVAMPRCSADGKAVLDVGCGTGKDLMSDHYAGATRLCGVEPDPEMIAYGREHYPRLELHQGTCESLPFDDESFDVVVARVSLPYANIPVALAEINRVMKLGGHLVLTMHDLPLHLQFTWAAIKGASLKRFIDLTYVWYASAVYALIGCVPVKPWNGRRETFQIASRFRRSLADAGFGETLTGRTRRHWIWYSLKFGGAGQGLDPAAF